MALPAVQQDEHDAADEGGEDDGRGDGHALQA
jgi:hypothetical protein